MLELNKEIKKIISNFDPDYSKNQKKGLQFVLKVLFQNLIHLLWKKILFMI